MSGKGDQVRTDCRGCGSRDLTEILDLGEMALAGGFLRSQAEIADERRFPLQVHVCRDCRLVQILEAIDPDILFRDYSFASSTIDPLVRHFEAYADWLIARFHPRTVVEFGCNDGVLLRPLQARGVRAIGVDLSPNIGDLARAAGLEVHTGAFDRAMAERIRNDTPAVDVVSGSNAFAHNDRPEYLLEAASAVLNEGGHLCLEVMYAGDLLDQLQWDTLYHEHLTFYSLTSLGRLLADHGFFITHAEHVPMHGGSLRVVAGRRADPDVSASTHELLAAEVRTGLNDVDRWVEFGRKSLRKIDVVRDVFGTLSHRQSIWAYGAAGKATMWVNACGMTYLDAVVDASPLRAGKLMPGTHTPIVFPADLRQRPPQIVFVTAWNYADLIRSKEGWFSGLWATPLPDLRFF
jgi:novobiocin biosynthesis protein NovU/D-mycarose 3-C-methyltransferase